MDVAVHPEGRLFGVGAGVGIRDGGDPDVAPFVALADALHPDEARVFVRIGVEEAGQIVVAVEAVEVDLGHFGGLLNGNAMAFQIS